MLDAAGSFLLSNTLDHEQIFLHWICIAGASLVKHVTIHWMHLRENDTCAESFCRQKMNKEIPYKVLFLFQIFHILKIKRMTPFCNLFMECHSYKCVYSFEPKQNQASRLPMLAVCVWSLRVRQR